MAIPHDDVIQLQLLELLSNAPDGTMHCNDVYTKLAELFPRLTADELFIPYRTSASKWANRVQWARQHLVQAGLLLRPHAGSGRGFWTISDKGRKALSALIDIV